MVAWLIPHCAHRGSTFQSCALCEKREQPGCPVLPTLLRRPTRRARTESRSACTFPTGLFARGREFSRLWFDCLPPARGPTQYIHARTVPAPPPARSVDVPRASAQSALRYRIHKILVVPRPYTDRTETRTDRTVGSFHDPVPARPHARPCSPIPARSLGMNSARRVRAPRKKTLSTSYSSCRNTS